MWDVEIKPRDPEPLRQGLRDLYGLNDKRKRKTNMKIFLVIVIMTLLGAGAIIWYLANITMM